MFPYPSFPRKREPRGGAASPLAKPSGIGTSCSPGPSMRSFRPSSTWVRWAVVAGWDICLPILTMPYPSLRRIRLRPNDSIRLGDSPLRSGRDSPDRAHADYGYQHPQRDVQGPPDGLLHIPLKLSCADLILVVVHSAYSILTHSYRTPPLSRLDSRKRPLYCSQKGSPSSNRSLDFTRPKARGMHPVNWFPPRRR